MSFTIPIAFFDPPVVLDTTVTPIPAFSSSPLQVISNTGLQTGVGMNYSDTTGEFIGIYLGAPGKEFLVCIIGNGVTSQAWAKFPAQSRVSLKAMKNRQITFGLLSAAVVAI